MTHISKALIRGKNVGELISGENAQRKNYSDFSINALNFLP
jgi:hypothetical protein